MQIRFNEQLISLTANAEDMYDLNDIWRQAALPENKRPSEWDNDQRTALSNSGNFRNKAGRYGGTWATKVAVYAYASWVSPEFFMAVYNAFEAAASGDGNRAVDIATSIVIDPVLIEREERLRETLNRVIKERFPEDKHAFSNTNRLLSKCFSGYTPKQLTDARMSAFKYAVHLGHTDGVGAYLAALRMAIQGYTIGLNYHQVAAMLEVETGKNKHILIK